MLTAATLAALVQLLFTTNALAAVIQTCAWRDGSLAVDYWPCTNATATSGNCCHKDDACTENGMCYGGVGLVYRGACINQWGGDCLTYCDDIFPCAYAGSGSTFGPQTWCCGAKGTEMCTQINGTHMININPGGPKRIVGQTSSTTSTNGATTATSSTTTGNSAANSQSTTTGDKCDSASPRNKGAMIGLGIVIGVLVLIGVCGSIWGLRKYRQQQRRLEAMIAGQKEPQVDSSVIGGIYQPEGRYQQESMYMPEMSNQTSLLKVEMNAPDHIQPVELGEHVPNRY